MRTKALSWIGLLALIVASTHSHGNVYANSGQGQRDVDSHLWAGKNIQEALNAILPMDRPNPEAKEQDYITYRYTHWIMLASREYSFSLFSQSYESRGSLITHHWGARVSMADGDSILEQLARLHSRNPNQGLPELESQVRIKTWAFDEKTCPQAGVQATKFLQQSFKAPFNVGVMVDAPSYEFRVSSYLTNMTLATSAEPQELVSWAKETRRALAQCGAKESAPIDADK